MFRPDLVGHLQGSFYNVCRTCFSLNISVRPNHIAELTKKLIIDCSELELVLCEYNVVARKIYEVKYGDSMYTSILILLMWRIY